MKDIRGIRELLVPNQKIAITTHARPDGDALGSSLALYLYLVQKGCKVKVVAPTEWGEFLNFLPGSSEIINFELKQGAAKEALNESRLIFCLDFNDPERVGDLSETLVQATAEKVLIDHHLNPTEFDDYRLVDSKASSTAELIYRFFNLMGDLKAVDSEIGKCLYTGIMTDTGSFRFASTTPQVHQVVSELLHLGIDHSDIHERIYGNSSYRRLRFLGHCLKDRLQHFMELHTAIIIVTREDYKEYNLRTGDTEGLVNYALSIKNVVLAVLMKEQDGLIKMSFRSKRNFPASEIASKFFSGGGHLNAAGGKSATSMSETIDHLKEALDGYTKQLKDNL